MDQTKKKGITIRIKRTKKTAQPLETKTEEIKEEPKISKCPTCGFGGVVEPKKEKKEKANKEEITDKKTSCKLCNISMLMTEFIEHKKNINHTRRQEIIKMLPKLTDEDVIKFLNSI